jgi:ATP-binding cassette subfamily F protein uup
MAKALAAAEQPSAPPTPAADVPPPPQTTRQKKLSYKEQRELAALPDRIAVLEKEIADIEAAFADPTFYVRDPNGATAANARLESARVELDAAETRWLELSEFA